MKRWVLIATAILTLAGCGTTEQPRVASGEAAPAATAPAAVDEPPGPMVLVQLTGLT